MGQYLQNPHVLAGLQAVGGALSTPMTPQQPLAPLGGAALGFAQGEQTALSRNAQQQRLELERQRFMYPYEHARMQPEALESLQRARTESLNNPKPRPLAPEDADLKRDQAEAARAKASKDRRWEPGMRGGGVNNTPEREAERKLKQAKLDLRSMFNADSKRVLDPALKPGYLEWLGSPAGKQALAYVAKKDQALLQQLMLEEPQAEGEGEKPAIAGPGSPENQAATAAVTPKISLDELLAKVPEKAGQPTYTMKATGGMGRGLTRVETGKAAPTVIGTGNRTGKLKTVTTKEQVHGLVSGFQERSAKGGTVTKSEVLSSLMPLVGEAAAEDFWRALSQ